MQYCNEFATSKSPQICIICVKALRRFCLTLTGEAKLWYETIRQVQLDWPAMQECFRQQYSKFGNTRAQYFHVWRSFQFDEATDTIDSYIHKFKQVAALL